MRARKNSEMAIISVLNPNSDRAMTAALAEGLAALSFTAGHRIICRTNDRGPAGIETDAHVTAVLPHLVTMIGEDGADACVIACFSDPGVAQLRSLTTRPVLGIDEAAYGTVLLAARRFGIISILDGSIPRHRRRLADLGLLERLGGDRAINVGVAALDGEGVAQKLFTVGKALRDEDGCEALILGCAGLGAYRKNLQQALGCPVIDPVQAAVAQVCLRLELGF